MTAHRFVPFALSILLASSGCTTTGLVGSGSTAWHDKYTASGTLGTELEKDFGSLLEVCGASILDTKHHDYSAIPNVLQAALSADLQKTITALDGTSSASLFRYIFSQRSLTDFWAVNPANVLPTTLFEMSDIPTPVKGLSSKIYSQTCASILGAAISVSLKPPVATLQAALSSQYKGNNSISLVRGTFYSPLYGVLTDPGNSADKLSAYLALWQYYRNNPSKPGTPLYYLSGFNGTAAFFLSGRSFSQEYDLKANVSGNWLVASMDAKVDASLKEEAKLTITDYVTIVSKTAKGDDDVAFRELPSPSDIAAEFARRRAVFKPVAEEYVRQSAPFVHYFELRGVPEAMCNGGLWEIVQGPAEIVLDDARFEAGACRYYARYNAPDTLDTVPQTIGYTIRARGSVSDAELAIPARFRPVTTKHPIPSVADFSKRATLITAASGERLLRWAIPIRFVDSQDPVRLELRPPTVSNAAVACGGTSSDITATAAADSNNPGLIVTVERRLVAAEVVDLSKEKECSFSASLKVALSPVGAPRDAVRGVNTSLSMPVLQIVAPTSPMPPPAPAMGGTPQ